MARLFTSGFELNSLTANVEFDSTVGTIGNPGFSIQSGAVMSGAYYGMFNDPGSAGTYGMAQRMLPALASGGTYYFRFNLKVHAFPTTADGFVYIATIQDSAADNTFCVGLTPGGKLRIYEYYGPTQIGSDSITTLSLDTLYTVELSYTYTSGALVLRINGSQEANGTGTSAVAIVRYSVGCTYGLTMPTAGQWYIDDLAVNNTVGSYQNSWPGVGRVICLRPNAAGDSAQWLRAGTDSGANWSQCNNIPPNDVTSYVRTSTVNYLDMYGCTDSGIGAGDTVNVVEVGGRFCRSAATSPSFKFRCIKTGSGTQALSAAITPNSATWRSNALASPWTSPLIQYLDPDGSAWTQATLDTMQIGVVETTDQVAYVWVSSVWAMVDYSPGLPIKIFAGTAQLVSLTPSAIIGIIRALSGVSTLTSSTPSSLLTITRLLSGAASLLSTTSDANLLRLIGLAGAAQLVSATPDTILQVARILAGSADLTSSTPNSVLTVLRVLAGIAELVSLTPDDVELTLGAIAKIFAGTAALQTTTPDAVLTTIRSLAGAAGIISLTPDAIITITRVLAGIAELASATPSISSVVIRSMAGAASMQTFTPDAILQILRIIGGVATLSSTTPDNIELVISGLIILAGIAALQSSTPDTLLTVARNLSGLASLISSTPDGVDLDLGAVLESLIWLYRRRRGR